MRVAPAGRPWPDDARRAVQLLAVGEPGRHLGDQLGVEGAVLAGRRSEVPAVDEVVGAELADVLGRVLVAVRQVHGVEAGEQLVDGGDRIRRCVVTDCPRVVTEEVAVEAVADLGDRHALQQRPRPAVLADDVVDERPHVPLGARRRQVPLIVADTVEEALPASTVRWCSVFRSIATSSVERAKLAGRRPAPVPLSGRPNAPIPDRTPPSSGYGPEAARNDAVPSPRVLGRTLDDSFAEAIRRDITTVTTARLCVNALYRYIGPFLAVVADGLDVSVAELGVALTVAQVCGFAAPAIGRLVDHLPRRRRSPSGSPAPRVGGLVVATCTGIVWFTVGLLTISTFNIVLVVGTGSWIADHVPFAQRSRVVGLNEMSWALGLLVGVSAMGLVTAVSSWRWAYATAALVAGVVVIVVLTRLDQAPGASKTPTPATTAGPNPASVWSLVPSTGWLAIAGVSL